MALGDDDLYCDDDLMSDFRTVSGREALAQSLYRRWTSDRGSLLDDPNYGTNLTDYINDDIGPGDVGAIVGAALAEARKDERVIDITGSGRIGTGQEEGTLFLLFEITTDDEGTFTLSVSVDDLTVELLDIQEAA